MNEPKIHSHIEDALSNDHPQAFTSISCNVCQKQIHSSNNECMATWVEAGSGNYCIQCFANIDFLSDSDGLLPNNNSSTTH